MQLIRMRASLLSVLVALATASCTRAMRTDALMSSDVSLMPVLDSAPERYVGLTNIFFAAVPPERVGDVRANPEWRDLQIADLVDDRELRSIFAARYKVPGDSQYHYVVDTTGGLDFRQSAELRFARHRTTVLATFPLTLSAAANPAHQRRVPFQVVAADDGYTYARIADYRSGSIRVNDRDYAVRVRNRSRGHPFYGPEAGTVFLIDLNSDGAFAERASVTVGGRSISEEQVIPRTPFVLGGQVLEIAGIDSAGRRLVLTRATETVAAVEQLRAPRLAVRLLNGTLLQFPTPPDTLTLLEFWSTSCPNTEKVRGALNALAQEPPGAGFRWVALARESEGDSIAAHLAEHPMQATVARYDSTTWARYNPGGVTPLFVVVDRQGIVQLRAQGATALEAVQAKVRQLRSASPIR